MRALLKRLKKDERGLTLVELLAVIVILGIVGLIAFVSIGNVIENSKKDAHVGNAQQLIAAAKLAEASTGWPKEGFSTEESPDEGWEKLDTLEKLTNPWNAEDGNYVGKVTKDGAVYKVTIDGDDSITLDIKNIPEDVVNQGRKAVEANPGTE